MVRISHWLAPSERITSRISGSMVASPVATFTTIGKKEMTKAVMTAGSAPTPTQIIRIGTIATLGIALNAISSG
ncbi:hypothetical protein D3C87_2050050 [compost metagenome]